jgi:hypothetical protein
VALRSNGYRPDNVIANLANRKNHNYTEKVVAQMEGALNGGVKHNIAVFPS